MSHPGGLDSSILIMWIPTFLDRFVESVLEGELLQGGRLAAL